MSIVLEARDVTVRAGRATILDKVSLAVTAGECLALVGPNGAGKSTLLRVMSGEITPQQGCMQLNGIDIESFDPRTLALKRAVLSQSISVAFPFTVAEIVGLGAGDRRGRRIDQLVADALAEVDLLHFAERVITTLSGGEQQRAHLARVLVQLACGEAENGPGVLFLDEPTASLDLRHQLDVLAISQRCATRGMTVIAVLHDLNLATLFAKRIVVLDRGRVAGDGGAREVVTNDMLERVFRVGSRVGEAPPADVPFVLPHMLRPGGTPPSL